ncbi:MAG: hypothetical protein GF346_11800 [Candidatus Eisenbacteria bacterium]|nr:hypothetical protein [Candidatus Latescibacterota bacterium]MBD3303120.1 hypothetical protein [Candidatus Eisenbacteria bacterium]
MAHAQEIARRVGSGTSVKKRVLLFTVLPTVFLGVTYFLLVEYVAREFALRPEALRILRYGGAGMVLLFSFAALASGAQLFDSIRHPLRTLSRIAEGTQVPPEQAAYLPDSDPELRFLFLRVHTLVQQNRSGAQTLGELESLKKEVEEVGRAIQRTNDQGILPEALAVGEPGPAGSLSREIQRFVDRLREDLDTIDRGLAEIAEGLADQEARGATALGEAEARVREIERLGTVWSLALEMARRIAPAIPGEVGSSFNEFTEALRQLRESLHSSGWHARAVAEVRSAAVTLRRTIADRMPEDRRGESVVPDPGGEAE